MRRLRTPVTAAIFAAAVLSALAVSLAATTASASADGWTAVPEVQSCSARPELGPGSIGSDVRCLQYLLIVLGFEVKYTGTYDAATADAVHWYQAQHPPLNADGVAGEQTLRSLGITPDLTAVVLSPGAAGQIDIQRNEETLELPTSSTSCLSDAEQAVGSSGPSVICLQRRLSELGLYPAAQTGSFDAALKAAVTAFQKSRPPLNVDGRAGPRTLAALGIWSGISPQQSAANGTPGPTPGVVVGTLPVAPVLTQEPNWNMTPDGIPYFGNRLACSRADAITIATEFARDGADIATQYWAVYIASREGGCRFGAININPATRDDSHCTFQINVLSGTFEPHGELGRRGWTPELLRSSMQYCADAASDLWVFCGRGPWTPPYSCAPPWEGASSLPKAPIVTTPTVPAQTAPPVATTPVSDTPTSGTSPPSTTTTPSAPVPETTAPPTGTTIAAEAGQGD